MGEQQRGATMVKKKEVMITDEQMAEFKEVADMLEKTDGDGNGTVQYEEFVDLVSGRLDRKDPDQEMKDGFAMFDSDSKGFINFKDIGRVALELGDKDLADNEPELKQIIDEINPQGVNFNDFMSIMERQGVI